MKFPNLSTYQYFFSANEDTPQVYAACGRGPRSTLRVLRHGLEVTEMAVSELPGNPNAVWTVKKRADGNFYPILIHAKVFYTFIKLCHIYEENLRQFVDEGESSILSFIQIILVSYFIKN